MAFYKKAAKGKRDAGKIIYEKEKAKKDAEAAAAAKKASGKQKLNVIRTRPEKEGQEHEKRPLITGGISVLPSFH